MANRKLKRYGLESAAKTLIAVGLLLVLISWIAGFYYYRILERGAILLVPFIFTCVLALLLLVIKYRYTLFEKYPYLMNLPSIFYRIGKSGSENKQSEAFSMIFTVHALVIAFMGLLSLILTVTVSISAGIRHTASPLLYAYFLVVIILLVSVLLQYRRIYRKFSK